MTDAKLKSYVERIDRVMTSMDNARADIAQIIKDAKGDGYIPKTLRKVATRYHANPDKIAAEDALLETYEAALGRVGKALRAIAEGATWEEARKAHDVPRATMARAAAVSKRREVIPDHDIETGEITPGDGAAGTAKPVKAQAAAPPEPCTVSPVAMDADGCGTGARQPESAASLAGEAVAPAHINPDTDTLEFIPELRGPSPSNRTRAGT